MKSLAATLAAFSTTTFILFRTDLIEKYCLTYANMMNVIKISNIKIGIAILYGNLRSEPLFFFALLIAAVCAFMSLEGKKTVSLAIFVCPFSLIVFVFVVVVVTK
ncbi:hypothetical protein, partial [Hymenobacter terricola]|uniref:hypothetical protein n=1 Tax=Hymenobacter terricola TaxID=2819236 RepID=UPI001CF27716